MNYRIIADSCCDKTKAMRQWDCITFVPLSLQIGAYHIQDDEAFEQEDYIRRMRTSTETAKTASPSPALWAEAIDCAEEDIYIITITDKLSGTYGSAMAGVMLYREEHPDSRKNIRVFNSLATSGIESLTAEHIKALADAGKSFDEITSDTEDFIQNRCSLYFFLETLEVLKSNGRLYAVAAAVLQKLKLKLIFRRTAEGNIALAGKERTAAKAIAKTAALIEEEMKGRVAANERLIVSHVCCQEKAERVVAAITEKVAFGSTEIVACSGLNSTYAADGGIIISFTR